jgi:hypothetical protein
MAGWPDFAFNTLLTHIDRTKCELFHFPISLMFWFQQNLYFTGHSDRATRSLKYVLIAMMGKLHRMKIVTW